MKYILKIIFFGAIIAFIIFGKQYIDKKTFDYKEVVDTSIENYFINGDATQLVTMGDLIDDYIGDDDFIYNIQSYSDTVIWSWFYYADSKYKCDRDNLNSCKVQLEEFTLLKERLDNLIAYRSKTGKYNLMLNSSYNNISSEVVKKLNAIQKVIDSPSAKNPDNSETVRKKKCAAAQSCEKCKDGVCSCTYIGANRTENINCNQ